MQNNLKMEALSIIYDIAIQAKLNFPEIIAVIDYMEELGWRLTNG